MCTEFEKDSGGTGHTIRGRFWISMSNYPQIKWFVSSRENVKVKAQFDLEKKHSSTLSLTSETDSDGCLTPLPGRITPGKETRCPLYRRLRASGPVWTGAENLAPTGVRTPDLPARSESLYRLRYLGVKKKKIRLLNCHIHFQHCVRRRGGGG
jgi:hypothetical protein